MLDDYMNFVGWVWEFNSIGKFMEVVDKNLRDIVLSVEFELLLEIVCYCIFLKF